MTGSRVRCGACDAVVFDSTNVVANLRLSSTNDDRRLWESTSFDGVVVHLCDPEERAIVRVRDGLPCALPRWQRWVNRRLSVVSRLTSGRRVWSIPRRPVQFCTYIVVDQARPTDAGACAGDQTWPRTVATRSTAS